MCALAHGGAGYTPWKGTVFAAELSGGSPDTNRTMQKGQGGGLIDCDAEGSLAWRYLDHFIQVRSWGRADVAWLSVLLHFPILSFIKVEGLGVCLW